MMKVLYVLIAMVLMQLMVGVECMHSLDLSIDRQPTGERRNHITSTPVAIVGKRFGLASKILAMHGGASKPKTRKLKKSRKTEKIRSAQQPTPPAEDDGLEEESTEGEPEDGLEVPDKPGMLRRYWDDFRAKTPPMTLVYLMSSTLFTTLSFMMNENRWPKFLSFSWSGIAKLQLWRLYTGFLYFGPLDLFYPLTLQFVWQHMSHLEKMNYKAPEEFVMMLGFGGLCMLALYTLAGIPMTFLGHNLATYLVYIWSRVFEGQDVNFMDMITLKAEYLPWFFSLQTMLLEQELPLADLLGIVVGHCYYYCKQKKLLKAPGFLKELLHGEFWKAQYARFQGEFE